MFVLSITMNRADIDNELDLKPHALAKWKLNWFGVPIRGVVGRAGESPVRGAGDRDRTGDIQLGKVTISIVFYYLRSIKEA